MQDAATEALYKRRSPTSRLLRKGPGSYTGALYFLVICRYFFESEPGSKGLASEQSFWKILAGIPYALGLRDVWLVL
jgi:hypothetical protein